MDPTLVIIIFGAMCVAVLAVGILQLYFQADAMPGARPFVPCRPMGKPEGGDAMPGARPFVPCRPMGNGS